MKNYIYVLNKNGTPLMPTTRSGHIRKLLKCSNINDVTGIDIILTSFKTLVQFIGYVF